MLESVKQMDIPAGSRITRVVTGRITPEEARIFQRRWRARLLRRIRRDRKLHDWLGRTFTYHINRQPHQVHVNLDIELRLVSFELGKYAHLHPTHSEVGSVTWTTDEFWSLLRAGVLEPS